MAAWGRSTGAGARVALFFGLTHELDGHRWIDRLTWRSVDAGIVVAHEAARWYVTQGFGPPAKLHVLWKGVDVGPFEAGETQRAVLRAALGLGAQDVAIGTFGRLAWQKGIDTLLAAARFVRPQQPAARFFVVGGGRDAQAIAAAVKAPELGGTVALLGQRDDVPALLAAMDIVVQSSWREVMAQTTLEAMAAARPLVSTATAGADEAIEHGVSGMIVPVGDAEALADRILALAADPALRTRLGRAARARIESHFTTARMLDRCEATFRAIRAGR
jgi:glycosyltransferase involved in cell wall biosynthesis